VTDSFLSTKEAAKQCGVTAKTVGRWVDAGMLPAIFTSGGHRRINQADLANFLASRRSLRSLKMTPRAEPTAPIVGARAEGKGATSVVVIGRNSGLAEALASAAGRLGLTDVAVDRSDNLFRAGLLIGRRSPIAVIIEAHIFDPDLVNLCAELRTEPLTRHCWIGVVGVAASEATRLARLAHAVIPGRATPLDADMLWREALGHASVSAE
jgi:excisionase family DNA binding protein